MAIPLIDSLDSNPWASGVEEIGESEVVCLDFLDYGYVTVSWRVLAEEGTDMGLLINWCGLVTGFFTLDVLLSVELEDSSEFMYYMSWSNGLVQYTTRWFVGVYAFRGYTAADTATVYYDTCHEYQYTNKRKNKRAEEEEQQRVYQSPLLKSTL
ncbi:hypothetical protein CLU79DRAFT_718270 [Phycomyces nitens]|nr:hypothetical protein CLU79DRAFT_718270 [Phycomyces nitens]